MDSLIAHYTNLHNQAMELAEKGLAATDPSERKKHLFEAFKLEKEVALGVIHLIEFDASRKLLLTSAIHLARDCGESVEAESLEAVLKALP